MCDFHLSSTGRGKNIGRRRSDEISLAGGRRQEAGPRPGIPEETTDNPARVETCFLLLSEQPETINNLALTVS